MKPIDEFVRHMIASAEQVRSGAPSAATETIQRALRQAGLLAPNAPEAAPGLVDLNPLPDSARARTPSKRTRPQSPTRELGPGRFIDGRFACADGARRYKLYIPARAAPGARPLVVMLHGCTQDAADFAAGTAMNLLAEEHGCLVLYPEQDRSANHSGCWNWFEPGQQRRGAGEPAILAGMTRQVIAEHGADPARVFVAGLSAGGAMAAILGAAYPELYAAVGVHSGLAAGTGKDMISGLHAMKRAPRAAGLQTKLPIIVFHGDADHVVHPGNGDAVLRQYVAAHGSLREQRSRGDANGRAYTQISWHGEDGRRVAEHWQIHGAGHAWMGGKPGGSHTDATGPCASTQMLAFFLQS
jgi:poly(hydroxyalkanoate) depolymerase family esterase